MQTPKCFRYERGEEGERGKGGLEEDWWGQKERRWEEEEGPEEERGPDRAGREWLMAPLHSSHWLALYLCMALMPIP